MEYDEALIRITNFLEKHPEGMTINQIAMHIGVHRNSIAKYADVLSAAGRIESRQVGPAKLYRIAARIPVTALLEASHDPIILISPQNAIISENEPARALETDKIIGRLSENIEQALVGSQSETDIELDPRLFEATILPVTYENASQGAAIILKDVTEKRALESQLKLLERAVASSSCGITIADMTREDEPLIYVNPAFEQITGYSSDEVLGRNCRFLQNEANQPERKIIKEAIANRTSCTVVIENYRKDGSAFLNELRLSPVRNNAGEVTHYIGIQTVVD